MNNKTLRPILEGNMNCDIVVGRRVFIPSDKKNVMYDEAVVYKVARTLNLQRGLPDDLYGEAMDILGRDGLVDLIGVLGHYALISMTIKAFDVDPIS